MLNQEGSKLLEITERTFNFSVRIVKLCCYLREDYKHLRIIADQLFKSGTSIGANIEEAKGAQSKADFLAKYHISLKEARETTYWLKLLIATDLVPQKRLQSILIESEEITKIIAASLITVKKKAGKFP